MLSDFCIFASLIKWKNILASLSSVFSEVEHFFIILNLIYNLFSWTLLFCPFFCWIGLNLNFSGAPYAPWSLFSCYISSKCFSQFVFVFWLCLYSHFPSICRGFVPGPHNTAPTDIGGWLYKDTKILRCLSPLYKMA